MNVAERAIAHQYAHAFVNIFGKTFSADNFLAFGKAAHFLATTKSARTFLTSPIIFSEKKREVLRTFIQLFLLPEATSRLVDIVLEHKQEEILPAIFEAIYQLYMAQKNIELFTIESSHPLVDKQKEEIENFLSKKTGKNIQARVVINPALIAGLRLQSASQVWEYSVRKQLNALRMVRKELYGN